MSEFTPTKRTQVQRLPDRGKYDSATIYPILDKAFLCHVGFVVDGHARVALAISAGERVPVVYVDLSEKEEALILATLDPRDFAVKVETGPLHHKLLFGADQRNEIIDQFSASYQLSQPTWDYLNPVYTATYDFYHLWKS